MNFSYGDRRFIHEIIRELTRHLFGYTTTIHNDTLKKITHKKLDRPPRTSIFFISFFWLLFLPIVVLCLYWRMVSFLFSRWFGDKQQQIDIHNIGSYRLNARKDRFMCIYYDDII